MPETTGEIAQAVSDAATGPGKPAQVTVSRPPSASMWAGVGALIVLAVIALLITGVFAFAPRPMQLEIWRERDHWLGWALIGAVILMACIAINIAWSRVSASGGPAHIDLGGDH